MGFCSCEERKQWGGETWSEACSIGVHAETRHRLWWNMLSYYEWNKVPILISLAVNNEFVYPIDGCCDCIVVWVTWFGYLYDSSWGNEDSEFNRNMCCVKLQKSLWLEVVGNDVVEPTEWVPLLEGYSNIDDCSCVHQEIQRGVFVHFLCMLMI